MNIEFFAAGIPVPQGSTKAFTGKDGRAHITSTSGQRLKDWRTMIGLKASEAATGVMEGPVWVRATFYLPRPKSAPKRILRPATRPDLDKFARALLDGGTGVLWRDDSQVVSLNVCKVFAVDGHQAGVFVHISDEPSAVDEMAVGR